MRFYTEVDHGDEVITDCIEGATDLAAAKLDVLVLLTQLIRIGFDGIGRTVSARIVDHHRRPVATMSLTLDV